MFRLLSLLLVGIGGYLMFQNRFRVVNTFLGSRLIRKAFVSSLMSIPFIRQQMMNTVFSGQGNRTSY